MIKCKYGFGRATDYVNEMIRLGDLTREEGIEIVTKYDGRCSSKYIGISANISKFQKRLLGKNKVGNESRTLICIRKQNHSKIRCRKGISLGAKRITVGILDYGVGNISSLSRVLIKLGCKIKVGNRGC